MSTEAMQTRAGQLARLRTGGLALALLFCAVQLPASLLAPLPGSERALLFGGLAGLMGVYVVGHRRQAFSPALVCAAMLTIIGLAPFMGSTIVGASFTGV